MNARQPAVSRRGQTAALLLVCALVAAMGGGPGDRSALAATTRLSSPSPAIVYDPSPAPGSVLAPGMHQIAASVEDINSAKLQFMVDGQAVAGPTVDADADLGNRRGASAYLEPGPHTLAVRTEDLGVLRTWDVLVVPVDIRPAGDDANLIAVRMAGSRAGARPAILVDPDRPGFGAVGAALASRIGGVLLPTGQSAVPTPSLDVIADVRSEQVIILGAPTIVAEVVAEQLLGLDLDVIRLGGDDAPSVSTEVVRWLDGLPLEQRPARGTGVVVAPVEPLTQALAAATRAATTAAPLVLIGPSGPDDDAVQIMSAAEHLLVGDGLSDLAVAQIQTRVPADVVRNRDTFTPAASSDLVIVTDDASAAAAVMATQSASPDRSVVHSAEDGVEQVRRHQPDRITIVGPDPTATELEPRLRRAWAGTSLAPRTQAVIDARTAQPSVTFTADLPLRSATVHVDLLGLEWPGQTIVSGDRVVWIANPRRRLPEPLEPQQADMPATIEVTATFTSHQEVTSYVQVRGDVTLNPVASFSRHGFVVAGGASDVVGTGPLRTFSVAVEPETGLSLEAVTDEIEQILLDPRGWTADGSVSLQRIGAPNSARIRVVVATPATVDAMCGAVGLRTGGRVSCWDGYRAMLNLNRWNGGVVPFHRDISVYRQYLVNHEVGHGLGHRHVFCPAPGALAPVMVQQTGGLGGCQPNGWPFPSAG